MNQIAIVIPINAETAVSAEMMMDWIRQLNIDTPTGSVLLLYDNVPDEYQVRLRTSASLAFANIDELMAPPRKENSSETNRRNVVFLCAAEYCQKTYRLPWLYLDPTSVPTKPSWLENIERAFVSQPKRYMGTHLKTSADSQNVFLMPTSIYHMGVFNDCSKAIQEAPEIPFELTAGNIIGPKSSKWRLIQPLKIHDESDFEKVWAEAQIVVGDASGAFIEKLKEDGVHIPEFDPPQKIDRRTKAGRALAQANGG